ncbi:MAG: lipoprotein [Pseudomonadota bacterium]|nr:lipoprotein [Pseudomonadota bacterium]
MSEESKSLVFRACARAALATCVSMGLSLVGCGQKGPLTLNALPKTHASPAAAAASASKAILPAVAASAASRQWGSPLP